MSCNSLDANISCNFFINFSETENDVVVSTNTIHKQISSSYSYPTGVTIGSSEADLAVKQTGVLESGGFTNLN